MRSFLKAFDLRSSRNLAWLTLASLLVLSFLPKHFKALLHTRGELHSWAHLYLFAGLSALFMERLPRLRCRAWTAVRLGLLAFTIEALQTRLHLGNLEVSDVVIDLAGIGIGGMIATLRAWPVDRLGGSASAKLMAVDEGW